MSIRVVHRPKHKGPFSMDGRERDLMNEVLIPHRISLAWEQQEADSRIIVK